jgi:hypothetical protein
VRTTPFEQALPYERFAQQQLNVLLGPLLSRQRLQEHHDFLEIHLAQLVRPLDEECCAYVKMEGRESIFLSLRHVSGVLQDALETLTRYVSHIRIVFFTEISRMSRQFIHRKLNCMNSTPSFCRCFARPSSIRVVRSRRLATCPVYHQEASSNTRTSLLQQHRGPVSEAAQDPCRIRCQDLKYRRRERPARMV